MNAGRWVLISRVMLSAGCLSVPFGPPIGSRTPYALSSKMPLGQIVGVVFHAYAGSLGAVFVPTSANAVNVNGFARSGAVVKCASPLTVPSESRTR